MARAQVEDEEAPEAAMTDLLAREPARVEGPARTAPAARVEDMANIVPLMVDEVFTRRHEWRYRFHPISSHRGSEQIDGESGGRRKKVQ